jgi:hypothetical protein
VAARLAVAAGSAVVAGLAVAAQGADDERGRDDGREQPVGGLRQAVGERQVLAVVDVKRGQHHRVRAGHGEDVGLRSRGLRSRMPSHVPSRGGQREGEHAEAEDGQVAGSADRGQPGRCDY